ncbi:hypothetical protein ACP7IZ_13685, partial [Acetobacter sp. AAB5]
LQHQRNQAASSSTIPNQRRRNGITQNSSETKGFSNPPGYRGAPRILLAILEHLGEISKQKQTD